jgi:hypothetical protein
MRPPLKGKAMITKSTSKKTGLQEAIEEVLSEMKGFTSDTEEYSTMVNQLTKLYKLKDIDKPQRVSLDTLFIVAGNLIGIVLIVGYERANIVTSKALNLLHKIH